MKKEIIEHLLQENANLWKRIGELESEISRMRTFAPHPQPGTVTTTPPYVTWTT